MKEMGKWEGLEFDLVHIWHNTKYRLKVGLQKNLLNVLSYNLEVSLISLGDIMVIFMSVGCTSSSFSVFTRLKNGYP